MPRFVRLCAVTDVETGGSAVVAVEGREVAVFNVGGAFHALDNACPHRGGPLGEGDLEGCLLTCPWHEWQFDVRTGESVTADVRAVSYETKIEGDSVWLRFAD